MTILRRARSAAGNARDTAAETDRHDERVTGSSVLRWLLMVAGVSAVALGTIGVFVPLLPTTPFLLLAAACFIRSSDSLYTWLIHHKWFGAYIRNYREHRAMTLRAKAMVLILLWTVIGYSALVVATSWWLRLFLGLVAVGVTAHLLHLKTLTTEMMQRSRDSRDTASRSELNGKRRDAQPA